MSPNLLDVPRRALLIVLSGPSGAGKDAVLNRMKQRGFPADFVTTATTRPSRPSEKDGIAYHFVSEADFQKMLAHNELLESARVYGHWYGVPKSPVREALARGRDVIVKVDVQGAATIKKLVPAAVFIFVTPPSIEELVQRLKARNTESTFDFELRTRTAEQEVKQLPLFDYLVFNHRDQVEQAVAEVESIITAEKCRIPPREISL